MKRYIIPVLELLLCVSLLVGYLVLGPAKAGANEVLSGSPAPGDSFLADTAAYYNDRFGFRQELITVNAHLDAALFRTSASDDVLIGKDGWLYYASTLPDFTGSAPMTGRELFSAANNLSLIAEYCQINGMDFGFLPMPNKSTVYPQYMSGYGSTASTHDLHRLLTLLEQMGVPALDIKGLFTGSGIQYYYAHDSHWNDWGAALGADAVTSFFGGDTNYGQQDFAAAVRHNGDLYEMLYPAATDPEEGPIYTGSLDFSYADGSGTRPDSILIQTYSQKDGSIFVYRDSFGNNLYPYLADAYGNAAFSRSAVYDIPAAKDFGCLLIELVERNLRYLITNIPVMPAPERLLELPVPSGSISLVRSSAGALTLWEGQIKADAASPVYFVTEDTAYRAFLTENDGISAMLPEGSPVTHVAYYANGTLTALEAGEIREGAEHPLPKIVLSPLYLPEEAAENEQPALMPEETQPEETQPEEPAINETQLLAKTFIDRPVEELIAAIGEPVSSDYASSCLGSGEDGNLYYEGFTVYTYREGTSETVRYVE